MLVKLQSAISLLTCGCLVCVCRFALEHRLCRDQRPGAGRRGNRTQHSTLFQGNVVQAGDTTSDPMFPGGSNLLLQPGATVRVFRDYGVLEHGAAIQRGPHSLVADGLKVSSLSSQGAAFVDVQNASHVRIVAQGGVAEVRNPAGVLVARLDSGKALTFAVQVPQQTQPPHRRRRMPLLPLRARLRRRMARLF
jgi:hypothetical protein